MRILLGGIPLGCDNIGDEAILACVIRIFRQARPDADLVISTRDREGTARKFNVETVPLYGFEKAFPAEHFHQALKGIDLFVWAGATGLSDYPRMGCKLLRSARRHGVETVVWNVGMNNVFNPSFFQLRGRKLALCELVRKITSCDLKQHWEARMVFTVRREIARVLGECRLVVLRDWRSLDELRRCAPFSEAVCGADSAMLQCGADFEKLPWSAECAGRFNRAAKRLAICISDQNPIRQQREFCQWLDRLHAANPDILTVMIPMNLKTDYVLMRKLISNLECPERVMLTDFAEPEEVQTLVGRCSLVLSSRLHLIILALNRLVPCIGIARGSKIPFFLDEFELPCAGSTEDIDFVALSEMVNLYLETEGFAEQARPRREKLLAGLDRAQLLLKQVLDALPGAKRS